jgi:D-alanyl-D-alanine carboxypeptidase (penicillin-binding protein 5/6)
MPRLDPTTVVTATYDEARADGGHVGLVPGATYTVWDLWHGLLLPSANDAAAALADANGGMATTVGQMQAMARRLRALDTTVRNDSGLDNPAQLSSAYDMTLIARAAMGIPDFRTVTASTRYSFPGLMPAAGKQRSTYMIFSQNRLLLHGYRGTIGGKTGFTSLAHRTFWGAATRGGHTLVVTLFQVHDPTEKAARALLDWGFASVGHVTPVGHLVDPVGPSPAAAPAGTVAAGSPTSAAAAATASSRFRLPWLLVGLVLVLLGALALWWRRRRPGRRGWPDTVSYDTAPLTVVAPPPGPPSPVVAPGTLAAPSTAPVAVPPPTGEAPDDLPVATVRPAPIPGGHVRLVTRPSPDEPS